jgi:AcrR family transcriptional regulator
MASRIGLDRRAVIAAAIGIVDDDGTAGLTMTRLADELGIRLPSLYAHVRGQLDLRRELWLWAVSDLGDRLGDSVMGRSGEDALFAFAVEFRDYARRHPGRYQLTLDPPVPFDDEAAAVRRRANAPFRAVVRSFGVGDAAAVHVGRALRAAIHGFTALEAANGLGQRGADESFRQMVALLSRGLRPD